MLKEICRKRTNPTTLGYSSSLWSFFITVSLILTVLSYNSFPLFQVSCRCDSNDVKELRKAYNQITAELNTIRQKHNKLISLIKRYPGRFNNTFLQYVSLKIEQQAPTLDYETLRRDIYSQIQELWYFISYQLNRVRNGTRKPVLRKLQRDLVEEVAQRKRWLVVQQDRLMAGDGFSEWRGREARRVQALVQRRLWLLQNPPNCRDAKKLVCFHNQGGFGCKHHHLMFCLMYAYATKRTLILSEQHSSYNYKGWTSVFFPLSDSCVTYYNDSLVKWTGPATSEAKVVHFPVLDLKKALKMKPLLLPYFIPKHLARRIVRFNSDPSSWWAGQILRYILKPRPHIQRAISHSITQMNLTDLYDMETHTPLVGIHVRRTDKNKEVPLFPIREYMSHVEDYYSTLELTRVVPHRRVYIATDDERVLNQAATMYPQYKFFGSTSRAHSASRDQTRYTEQALTDLLVDLYILTMCDYVVGTFSSNYGKMAYELMQSDVDATHRFHSLDDGYFMCSSTLEPHYRRAVMRSNTHPKFEVGDLIKHYYFRPDSVGKVMRTQEHGPVPWYKTVEHISTYPFSEYENVPIYIEHTGSNKIRNLSEEKYSSFIFGMPRRLMGSEPFPTT